MNTDTLLDLVSNNDDARRLLAWAIERKRNAWTTPVSVIERELGLNHQRGVALAKSFGSTGFGTFVKGRRPYKSRIEWPRGLWFVADAATQPSGEID